MSRRYLVTGGLGFLGSALVRSLAADGHRVRVLDNASRGAASALDDPGLARDRVELMSGDVRDPDAVRRAVRGTDVVCHLAFINGTEYFYSRPAEVLDVGVKGMVNVLDACVAERVGELLLVSSSEVYQTPPVVPTDERVALSIPDPLNPRYSYAGGKLISELMAINYGREHFKRVLIARPHNVFGPRMGREHVIPQFIHRLLDLKASHPDGEVPFSIQGTGEQTRAFIFIDDFIRGLRLVLDQGEHLNIYHIGTMEERTIAGVAHEVAECLGLQIRVAPGPEASGGTLRRCPDVRKLRALGFAPRCSFAEGLRITVDWYAAAHAAEPTRAVPTQV